MACVISKPQWHEYWGTGSCQAKLTYTKVELIMCKVKVRKITAIQLKSQPLIGCMNFFLELVKFVCIKLYMQHQERYIGVPDLPSYILSTGFVKVSWYSGPHRDLRQGIHIIYYTNVDVEGWWHAVLHGLWVGWNLTERRSCWNYETCMSQLTLGLKGPRPTQTSTTKPQSLGHDLVRPLFWYLLQNPPWGFQTN